MSDKSSGDQPSAGHQAAITALLLVVGGAVGFWSLSGGGQDTGDLLRLFDEVGAPLPVVVQLFLGGGFDGLSLLLGLGGAAGILAAARLAPPRLIGPLCGFLGLVLGTCLLAGFFLNLGLLGTLAGIEEIYGKPRAPREPGRTAEIAEQVDAAFRASLAAGTGRFVAPDGQAVEYLVLRGAPGLPGEAGPPPPYEEARQQPGCLLLPWGPAGNRNLRREPMLFWPSGEAAGIDPAELGQEEVAWILRGMDGPAMGETEEGSRVLRHPAVVEVPGEGALRYGYSLTLVRCRLDDAERTRESAVFQPPTPTRLGSEDAYGDALYELRISIFRGFDPSRRGEPYVPIENLPVATYLTLVAR